MKLKKSVRKKGISKPEIPESWKKAVDKFKRESDSDTSDTDEKNELNMDTWEGTF